VSFSNSSQKVFNALLQQPDASALQLAEQLNLIQNSDSDSLQPLIEEVIAAFPEKVAEYKSGKKGLLGMFMGEVMKKSKGKADPKMASAMLQKALED
jgi:aspartyl-tRNA(Asn)/glutamyl-tRNA(Gln) amidotransferase subunit B